MLLTPVMSGRWSNVHELEVTVETVCGVGSDGVATANIRVAMVEVACKVC